MRVACIACVRKINSNQHNFYVRMTKKKSFTFLTTTIRRTTLQMQSLCSTPALSLSLCTRYAIYILTYTRTPHGKEHRWQVSHCSCTPAPVCQYFFAHIFTHISTNKHTHTHICMYKKKHTYVHTLHVQSNIVNRCACACACGASCE